MFGRISQKVRKRQNDKDNDDVCNYKIIDDPHRLNFNYKHRLYFHLRMIYKLAIIFLLAIITHTQNHSLTSTDSSASQLATFISQNASLLVLLLFLILLALAVYIDKRNGSRYMTIVRQKTYDLYTKVQNIFNKSKASKKEKLAAEEGIASSKDMQINIFDSEKTYVEADISSIQQSITLEKKLEAVSSLQFEEEEQRVDLREVFEQKDGQSSKRSRSKIRSRVQIKKSERESEDSQETQETKENNSFEISKNEE